MVVLMDNVSFGSLFPISVFLRWLGLGKEGVAMALFWVPFYADVPTLLDHVVLAVS